NNATVGYDDSILVIEVFDDDKEESKYELIESIINSILVIEVFDDDKEESKYELIESIINAFQQLMKNLAKEYELIESIINALQRLMNNLNNEKQENKQIKNEKLFLQQKNERIKAEKLVLEQENERIRAENFFLKQKNEQIRNEINNNIIALHKQIDQAKEELKTNHKKTSRRFVVSDSNLKKNFRKKRHSLENQIKILEQSNSRLTAEIKIEKKEKHL
ncbi:27812_t:CDS:2, partial [Gigaspora margarita]